MVNNLDKLGTVCNLRRAGLRCASYLAHRGGVAAVYLQGSSDAVDNRTGKEAEDLHHRVAYGIARRQTACDVHPATKRRQISDVSVTCTMSLGLTNKCLCYCHVVANCVFIFRKSSY